MSELSRRDLLRAGAGLALGAYGLSGCTVERPLDIPEAGRFVKPGIDGDLLIYNWAQYMDPDIKKGSRRVRGRGPRGQLRQPRGDGDQAALRGPLRPHLAEHRVRLPAAAEGLLARSTNSLRNRDKVSAFYDHPWWDPDAEYGVPYTYYTTGIAWREDEVSGMTGSWATSPTRTAPGGCSSSTTSRRRSARRTS